MPKLHRRQRGSQLAADHAWELKRREARGWLDVVRLAERLRREREGRPLLELVADGPAPRRARRAA